MIKIDTLNIENLKTLRDALALVPEKKFDHGSWVSNYRWTFEDGIAARECGTTACVGGWACIVGNLAPYKTDENGFITFDKVYDPEYDEETDPAFADLAAKWMGLPDDASEHSWYSQGAVFWPFDLDREYNETHDPEAAAVWRDWVDNQAIPESFTRVMREEATAADAVRFIDKMIERGGVDVTWWGEDA